MKPFTKTKTKAEYFIFMAIIKDAKTRLRNINNDIIKAESIDIENSVAPDLKSEKNLQMEKHK